MVTTVDLLILSGLVSAVFVGWWHWENHTKKIPLKEFGLGAVQRVLKFEPERIRNEILKRGWLTRAQWMDINTRQVKAIETELSRRAKDGE